MLKRLNVFQKVSLLIIFWYLLSHYLSYAYWVWTPQTKKWVNPKYLPKGTPREQYDWAMQFYLVKDYSKAIIEFKKLIKVYPQSELAPDAQYYIGRSYEERREYYAAFLAYQKVIEIYPRSELTDEIIERQYRIGNLYFSGQKEKLFGVAFIPALDKALEIFEKVVNNSPYGKYADLAQFKIGECYKKNGQYKEAADAFGKVASNYPKSLLYEQAKYEVALCTYKMSLKPRYDQEPTEEAMKEFEDFVKTKDKGDIVKDAEKALVRLQETKAESLYNIGRFYEGSKRYESAVIYYKEIIESYPKTSWAKRAFNKITELEKRIEAKKHR
ncbi:MAG: outer membrane protein assembly factor BamD [Candidatus Omnitrophica bacterium]|nr:outer membrane protein assembly factor BamD [Candidatus Omnitrophota bacterium]